MSLLDHRRKRLLGGSSRLEEGREVRAFPQLRNLELDRPGARLAEPITQAITVIGPRRGALAMGRALQAVDCESWVLPPSATAGAGSMAQPRSGSYTTSRAAERSRRAEDSSLAKY